MKSKNILVTLAVIILLGIGTGLIYNSAVEQAAITTKTFVNPEWARLECAPTDSYEGDTGFLEYEDDSFISCGIDEYTDKCLITLKNTAKNYVASTCILFNGVKKCIFNEDDTLVINMNQGEKYKIEYIFGQGSSDMVIRKEYKPWKLYRFVGGAKWEVNDVNCKVTTSLKAKIRSEDYPGAELFMSGGEGSKWINYINAWNYGLATNVFKHSQYGEVYCNAGMIYDIVELSMSDGSIKKVDPDYIGELEDGTIFSGMGAFLENVECCPNEPNCGDDFTYKETLPKCFTDAQCLNAGGPVPVPSTQYIKFVCEDSTCVKRGPFTVECTSNIECPIGQICDLSTTNYGNCITQQGRYCGDGDCSVNEDAKSCPDDCANIVSCTWYQDKVPAGTIEDCGLFGYKKMVPFVQCENKSYEASCKTSIWVFLLIGGIILLGSLALVLLMPKKGAIKR